MISLEIFEEKRYGCPCYNGDYGAKCPATGRQCLYENCPFRFWLNINQTIKENE